MPAPTFSTFDVDGGKLGALVWHGRPKSPIIVGIHGITANAWHWDAVAHHLAGAATMVAVDLRGRGRSFGLPGPFGMRRHADDVAAVVAQIESGPLLLAGHSMGTYVAMMTAERHPDVVAGLVLVDGGTPLTVPADTNIDDVLDQTLGPAIERLNTIWPDRVSYLSMWTQHPAFADGISVNLERTLLADLIELDGGGWRTAVDADAVRADGRELFGDADVRALLERCAPGVPIVRAPLGLMGEPPPLLRDEVVAEYQQHRWIDVPDTNHYTVLLGPIGAPVVAQALTDALDQL